MVIRVNGVELNSKLRTIEFRGRQSRFEFRSKPVSWKVVEALVCGGGLTAGQLIDVVYAEDPDGGPESAFSVMGRNLCDLRKRCAKIGLIIRSFRTGHASQNKYEIVPAESVA